MERMYLIGRNFRELFYQFPNKEIHMSINTYVLFHQVPYKEIRMSIKLGFGTQGTFFKFPHPKCFWMPFGMVINNQQEFLVKIHIFGW